MVQSVDLTVIIVNYKTPHLLHDAIDRVNRASKALSVQTIIVDNASNDGSVELIRRDFAGCQLIANDTNVGFGRANNQVLGQARGRHVLLLNTDAFVPPDALEKGVDYMDAHPRCGILGVKLLTRDGALQSSARYFPTPWNLFLARTGLFRLFRNVRMVTDMRWDHAAPRQCDWVPGCFYLVRRALIDQVGLFDPRYFLYCEDVDHCFAAKRAGWEVVCDPGIEVVHIGGESAKSEGALEPHGRQLEPLHIESELLYFRKNHGVAGVWLYVLLMTIGGAILVLKQLLKRKVYPKHATLLWSLFSRTRWGMRPTR